MNLLPHELVETSSQPNASVIWLHGLGADGNDFKPIVNELHLPTSAEIRFIFPHAPSMPVTINNGMVMPAWYDILDMSIDRKVDLVQLQQSASEIVALIEAEHAKGIAYERIIIAGFSQGGAVALETALSFPEKLGGLLAMSTYFASKETVNFHPANHSLPIEVQHGQYDPVVPLALGENCFQTLKTRGYPVSIQTYPMEHAVCPQQIQDIRQWLLERLNLQ